MTADSRSAPEQPTGADDNAQPAARPARLRALLVPLGLALLFLTGVEITLRVSGWSAPRTFFVVDDQLGRRLLPNMRTVAWGHTIQIDDRGLRVPENEPSTKQPAAAGPRFLFIGGSSTFGYGLEWRDTYPQQFARLMRERGMPITVINGGVPLGDSANRRAMLRTIGEQLRPDVIVFSEAVNDLAAMMNPSHQCFVDGQVMLHITRPESARAPLPVG